MLHSKGHCIDKHELMTQSHICRHSAARAAKYYLCNLCQEAILSRMLFSKGPSKILYVLLCQEEECCVQNAICAICSKKQFFENDIFQGRKRMLCSKNSKTVVFQGQCKKRNCLMVSWTQGKIRVMKIAFTTFHKYLWKGDVADGEILSESQCNHFCVV